MLEFFNLEFDDFREGGGVVSQRSFENNKNVTLVKCDHKKWIIERVTPNKLKSHLSDGMAKNV